MNYSIAWVCIGAAAGLAACVWPFRRGVLGIAMNIAAGVAGAVGGARLGVAMGVGRSAREPLMLAAAALGAFAALGLAHLVWTRMGRLGKGSGAGKRGHRGALEARVDDTLSASFPASDPPSWTLGVQPKK